ncbi:MAG: TauD/TfdA family dioxygenase [Longimicrobiaceae bacterium]
MTLLDSAAELATDLPALEGPVCEEEIAPGQVLPLVIRPTIDDIDARVWARSNRAAIEARLALHGAVLFRGFPVESTEGFHDFAAAVAGELLEYKERSSPRHEEGDKVYTSTDFPPEHRIYLHNEHSYACRFPMKLFFCCLVPADEGGATPLADVRRVYDRIDPAVREEFERKKYMYVRNFGSGFGLPWQTTFQSDDPAAVEAYCVKNDIQWEWKDDGGLRTRQVRPAVSVHPRTGEPVWFNHATFFHITTLAEEVQEMMRAVFAEEDLPNNTYYGDGSPIEDETVEHLRAAYDAETVRFDWEKGDVCLVDNMLAAHAREAFTGERKVLVCMAQPHTHPEYR